MPKLFEDKAFAEYEYWQFHDRKVLKRINDLIKDIERNGPMTGIGKPEKLKYLKNYYSRHIDEENRLIYKFSPELLTVVSCKGHYE